METDQFWDSPVFQVTDDGSMAPLDHRTMVTVTHGATVGGLDRYWMLQWSEWVLPSKTHVEMQLPLESGAFHGWSDHKGSTHRIWCL